MFSRPAARSIALVAGLLLALASPPLDAQSPYTVYTAEGRRNLPVRSSNNAEMVALNQLAPLFGLTIAEDAVVEGLTVTARGQRILLFPGQTFAQVNGRLRNLPAQVQRDRNTWLVPIEFLTIALEPALGVKLDIRKASRIIVVGDVRVPRISGKFERNGASGRLTIDIQPPVPQRVTRDGDRITVRFEAAALDSSPLTGLVSEFVRNVRYDGTSMIIDLGSASAVSRPDSDLTDGRLTIDLGPQAPPPPPPPPATPPPAAVPQTPPAPQAPLIDLTPGAIRTVVIDPGHGGEDTGAKGPGGTVEKDLTLEVARKLKAAIEGRMGLRVLLTRDADGAVPVDARTSLANNNKADLFLSLHANSSVRPDVAGAQVLSLSLTEYENRPDAQLAPALPVPVLGGGLRQITPVPWDLAQLPFVARSRALASILVTELGSAQVPMHVHPVAELPLRVLVGANMPAILVEMGFLTNAAEETALKDAERQNAIVTAILTSISQVRRGIPEGR